MIRQPIEGRAHWYGKDLEQSGAWIRTLADAHRAEIDAALTRVKQARLPLFGFTRDDFPLPATASLLAEIGDELENGLGAMRLRGLPIVVAATMISGRSSGASAGTSASPSTRTPAARSWARCATRRDGRKDLRAARGGQGRVLACPRPFHRAAALAHRPLRCHRAAVRAQRQGRRRQQARQHRHHLQRDPAAPPGSAGAAVPGLLALAPSGRGRQSRRACSRCRCSACRTAS